MYNVLIESVVKNEFVFFGYLNGKVNHFLFAAKSDLNKADPKDMFLGLNDLEKAAVEFYKILGVRERELSGNLLEKLDHFIYSYGKYIKGYVEGDAVMTLISAKNLYTSLDLFRKTLIMLRGNLENNMPTRIEGQEILSLLLYSKMTFSELNEKLSSLNSIYDELCNLFSISTNQYPLEIIKVESGSLWAKVFGESKVISLMTDLIERYVYYFYRNFTQEGKIKGIPKKIDVIESILQLEHHLREAGIETDEMRDNIQKSSILISQRLNDLLSDEMIVNLNGELYSIIGEADTLSLKERKPLLLDKGESSDSEDTQ
jgi:hypothetical protein